MCAERMAGFGGSDDFVGRVGLMEEASRARSAGGEAGAARREARECREVLVGFLGLGVLAIL